MSGCVRLSGFVRCGGYGDSLLDYRPKGFQGLRCRGQGNDHPMLYLYVCKPSQKL